MAPRGAPAHRYAITLVALGHLEQNNQRKYLLSHHAAESGMAFIETIRRETPAALTILEDLRDQTGHTVSMGLLESDHVTYTHRLFAHGVGQYEADLDLFVGAKVPVHCTAIGKALLASLAQTEQSEVLARIALAQHGPKTITDPHALAEQLGQARAQGFAICDEEQAHGVRSIAAAIPHPGRSRPLAISVTVPAQRHTVKAMIETLSKYVKAAAERI